MSVLDLVYHAVRTPVRAVTLSITITAATATALAACTASSDTPTAAASAARAGYDVAGAHRQYGTPQKLGNGTVRTYMVLDQKSGTPLEIGVAMSEQSMLGLPAPMAMSAEEMKKNGHAGMNVYLLDLPAQNRTQYQFVQFDWNPAGHEPEGIYTVPHFDFHFYTVSREVRASILPSDPQFAAKAADFPAPAYRYGPFYLDAATLAGAPPAAATVPEMGLHWLDVRSPELQAAAGHPENYQPFTKTFIYGSWDGQFIFDEPMITRAYLMAKHDATDAAVRDETVQIPTAARYSPAGYYPSSYRITWDGQAKEYRVALTQLEWKN